MTLNIYPFSNEICFNDNYINVLEIRNTKLFYNISRSFIMYCDNIEGIENIRLFDKNGEQTQINKNMFIVNNLFDININDKKILTKLYDALSKSFCSDNEKLFIVNEAYSSLLSNFIDIFNEYDLDFEYSFDFNPKSFFKMIGLEFSEERVDFLKNLYYLIDIVSEFNLYEIVVFNNLKAYINDEELFEFYKYCVYKKVNILLIEPGMNRVILEYENKLIIDEDYHDYKEKI